MSQGWIKQIHPQAGPDLAYQVDSLGHGLLVTIDGRPLELQVSSDRDQGWCRLADGRLYRFHLSSRGDEVSIWVDGYQFVYQRTEPGRGARRHQGAASDEVLSPMPGVVTQVLVTAGDSVTAGQPLLVMESMKMELVITSPRDGHIAEVSAAVGGQVQRGIRLVLFKTGPEEP